MANTIYCWRCRCDMPMLTEDEWDRLAPHLGNLIAEMKAYQAEHGCSLGEARAKGMGAKALALYEEIAGFHETTVNALFHHRLSPYGMPCPQCGKPLRTPQARHCAMCSWKRPDEVGAPE